GRGLLTTRDRRCARVAPRLSRVCGRALPQAGGRSQGGSGAAGAPRSCAGRHRGTRVAVTRKTYSKTYPKTNPKTNPMIDVDLLPPDEVRHAAEMRRVRLWCGGILAVAVVSVSVAHGAVELAATVSGRRLARLEAELAGLRRPAAALARLRQRRGAV